MATFTEVDGPTPAGGVKAIAYWLDADGDPCEQTDATQVEIHELDKDGNAIRRSYGQCGRTSTANEMVAPSPVFRDEDFDQ
jgi:hypothetical protein